jgi:hypothetical protein
MIVHAISTTPPDSITLQLFPILDRPFKSPKHLKSFSSLMLRRGTSMLKPVGGANRPQTLGILCDDEGPNAFIDTDHGAVKQRDYAGRG